MLFYNNSNHSYVTVLVPIEGAFLNEAIRIDTKTLIPLVELFNPLTPLNGIIACKYLDGE